MSAGCRRTRSAHRAGADPQGRGAAHARLSRAGHQAAAGGGAADGRAARDRAAGRAFRRHRQRLASAGRASGADQGTGSRISSRSPSAFSTRLICGAARHRSASTARGWCRSRCRPPASPARATATCRNWRSANCRRSAELRRGDLVFWKGHVAIARDGETLAPRQRASHGGGDRAGGRGDRAHQGGGQRSHQREADLTSAPCATARRARSRLSASHCNAMMQRAVAHRACVERRNRGVDRRRGSVAYLLAFGRRARAFRRPATHRRRREKR